ncbi:MAG: L-2-hydroxyglutarate oxidase [Ignavibacteriales bacterium]|nr:MAG: L-2-hydroxyglutarate oxidase [Ignavibacteriales bacterium]
MVYDITVVGGGIIGTATALSILQKNKCSLLLIESENRLAYHQTGNNSGVIHSGLYYKPGSQKAINCAAGREMMYGFCREHSIPHEQCGKLVVAVTDDELPALSELERRGNANGLTGLKRLKPNEAKEIEPYINCVEALFVPQTGIVDYTVVTNKYSELIKENGGQIFLNRKFIGIKKLSDHFELQTTSEIIKSKIFVNCGGLYSDRIAKLCGINPGLKIIPFRGEYYKLKKSSEKLVRNLIYPVPDPAYPFLGVHFTRMMKGGVEAGPNAVFAFKREGYKKSDISFSDLVEMFFYPGFIKMASKHYKMGMGEFFRSYNKNAFTKALQKLIPSITKDDIVTGGAGVRAQALEPDGKLVDDFRIISEENMVHVLNAPSPAATASLSIGKTISEIILKMMN